MMKMGLILLLLIIAYFLGRRHGEDYATKRVLRILHRKEIELKWQNRILEKVEKN